MFMYPPEEEEMKSQPPAIPTEDCEMIHPDWEGTVINGITKTLQILLWKQWITSKYEYTK